MLCCAVCAVFVDVLSTSLTKIWTARDHDRNIILMTHSVCQSIDGSTSLPSTKKQSASTRSPVNSVDHLPFSPHRVQSRRRGRLWRWSLTSLTAQEACRHPRKFFESDRVYTSDLCLFTDQFSSFIEQLFHTAPKMILHVS